MKKIFFIFLIFAFTVSPAFSYSYCYKADNGHMICNQVTRAYGNRYSRYYNNFPNYYNNYRMPTYYPMPRYSYRLPGGANTAVNFNSAGSAVSVQYGGIRNTVRSLNNNYLHPNYNNSGATFIIK